MKIEVGKKAELNLRRLLPLTSNISDKDEFYFEINKMCEFSKQVHISDSDLQRTSQFLIFI